jgi:predicted ATP-grasp superfamily ATP-dependent carboligase
MMPGTRPSARTPDSPPALVLDSRVPALVLRLAPNIFHHGTLGVLRSLGRAGIEVHAMLERDDVPAARSRYVHRRHPVPASTDEVHLLEVLHRIGEQIGRRALLVTVDDLGAIFVARHAGALRHLFLLPDQPPDLPNRVADKASLIEVCADSAVPHPQTLRPRSADDVAAAVERLGLPLVAKWSRPWETAPTPTTLLHTVEEVHRTYALGPLGGGELLLQRRVPPAPGSDWFFHGYFDAASRCLFGGAGRKERAYPPQTGLTTLGRWLPNSALEVHARRLAARLGYSGVLDLDFRFDRETGEYSLLDFNPRLGAQFRLFTDRQGLDLVRAQHLDLTGREVPPVQPRYGRAFLVENYDPVSAAIQLWQRRLSLPECRRSLRGVRELAWWSRDDPRPALAMLPRWCGACYRRLRTGSEAVAPVPANRGVRDGA